MKKITGSVPCMGTSCGVLFSGELTVGDDIFAVVEEKPRMNVKEA